MPKPLREKTTLTLTLTSSTTTWQQNTTNTYWRTHWFASTGRNQAFTSPINQGTPRAYPPACADPSRSPVVPSQSRRSRKGTSTPCSPQGIKVNGLVCWGKSTGNPWVFTIKYRGFRWKFSYHPILWQKDFSESGTWHDLTMLNHQP